MAPPQPKAHRPQKQSMTVALRNICHDYPAGGSILRELLQNADDAGALSVRFVLDLGSYPTDNLLHSALAQYQGPALLAYNDAIFSEPDFDSLSRVGDSRKLRDGSTTGKFGRGFNSVYNWTDSPSIVSKNTLLILDPHQGWSASFQNSIPGGPMYDFVADAEGEEMKNQMSAFSSIIHEINRPFQGTIIRIPLRTEAQATQSEICSRATTVPDVEEVIKNFCAEFGTSGLLFMKHVERIRIEIGNVLAFYFQISNAEDVRRNKQSINEMINAASMGLEKPFEVSFNVDIETASTTSKGLTSFAVSHNIARNPTEEKLRDWCKTHSMVPWIAVATQISANPQKLIKGSLFTVLPLQIPTNQPVHIHGIFSLLTNRAQLHNSSDASVQDQLPAKWNEWLFTNPIPIAWTNLLLYLSNQYPNDSAFDKWPIRQENTNDMSHGMIQRVLRVIQEKCCKIWYTDLGYVNSHTGLLAIGNKFPGLKKALSDVEVHVIYLPDTLMSSVQSRDILQLLTPVSLYDRLKNNINQVRALAEDTKAILLEYIVSDRNFRAYGEVELFPFEDGTYKSIDNAAAFIHRNIKELSLFSRRVDQNVDLSKLSINTLQVLKDGLLDSSLHSSLRRRSAKDLKTYCLGTYFKNFDKNLDMVHLSKDTRGFVLEVWEWIVERRYKLSDEDIDCLWLIPLSNGCYRKIKPQHKSSETIYAPVGDIGDFLSRMAKIDDVVNHPIVLASSFSSEALQLFVDALDNNSNLLLTNGIILEDFIRWLSSISAVVDQASDAEKVRLQELLVSHRHSSRNLSVISSALRDLKIFRKMIWTHQNETEPSVSWTSLNGFSQVIGLRQNIPLPNRDDVLFLELKSDITTKFLEEYQLALCPSRLVLLAEYVIPCWESGTYESLSKSCREDIAKLLLCDFFHFEEAIQERLRLLPFIPVSRIDGKSVSKFTTASQLINSSDPLLRSLFFNDEEVCPAAWVASNYKGVLIECGLQMSVTNDMAESRIRFFATQRDKTEPVWERGRTLLQAKVAWKVCANQNAEPSWRELEWLPAVDNHDTKMIVRASQCRGLEDRLLVGLILPVITFDIEKEWIQRLGWNKLIPAATLLEQLQKGIKQSDRRIVNAVLKYIHENNELNSSCKALEVFPCVLAQNGCFVDPHKTFRTGCERLEPYLQNVDNSFWHDHGSLLTRLGIRDHPDLEDLIRVQTKYQAKVPLDEIDFRVGIEVIKLAAAFNRELLSDLMIITTNKHLCAIEEAVYYDYGPTPLTSEAANYAHQDIPSSTIEKLRLEPLSERLKKEHLGLADVDDEEFDQREEVATGIADTLDRYPVEATFKEYLANADDARATRVEWFLDRRQHPQLYLLTDELAGYQGAALLVHNNGIFREEDFEGLKRVGRGSKRDDSSTIGKFGKGSQTMYHWTDVPMLLSGKYLVILDPLQQVLPMNSRKGHRKSGVRIELSKLKSRCPNQLAPFEGICGYSQSQDYYEGTIFRFPLRPATIQSRLRESNTPLDYTAAQRYVEGFAIEARISLLFLRNVRSMQFKVHGESHPRWSIQLTDGGKQHDFCQRLLCTLSRGDGSRDKVTIKDRWRRAVQGPLGFPGELPNRHKRTMKNVGCGMAVLISSKLLDSVGKILPPPEPKFFNVLPLLFPSNLPVHINAPFLTTGDRQSISIEESATENGADWNRWLLASAIPLLYLEFLEDLAKGHGKMVFDWWPTQEPPKGSLTSLTYSSFWCQLPNSPRLLFPQTRQLDKRTRRVLNHMCFKEAVFDFLPNDTSQILQRMLQCLIPRLIRVPFAIKRIVKSLKLGVTSVTPGMLRKLFRSDASADYLANSKPSTKFLNVLLKEMVPKSDADYDELHGCCALRLADGTYGTLKLVKSLEPKTTYYLVNDSEMKLFDFASDLLTLEEEGRDFKAALLRCRERFNIKRLELSDIGTLLAKKNFNDDVSSSKNGDWLLHFWKFWQQKEGEAENEDLAKTTFSFANSLRNYPILLASRDGAKTYLTLSEFDSLPSVVEPAENHHQKLCNAIPGLYILNRMYIPEYLKLAESSLDNAPSFERLVTSMSLLDAKKATDLISCFSNTFRDVEFETLRDLVANYLKLESSGAIPKHLLKFLPIWPSLKSPEIYLRAGVALVADDYDLLAPWAFEYEKFVQPDVAETYSSTLRSLGTKKLSNIYLLKSKILTKIPNAITPHQVEFYAKFLSATAQVFKTEFSDLIYKIKVDQTENPLIPNVWRYSNLALDEKCVLHPASELFDHDDVIFQAAFRKETTPRFLHAAIRKHKIFWVSIGLRQRNKGKMAPSDYILCLQTLKKRLEARKTSPPDSQLLQDAREILSPLTSGSNHMFWEDYRAAHWRAIQREAIFPALTNLSNQKSYRQDAMATLSVFKPLLPLVDVIDHQYIPVCWSQTSFSSLQVSSTTFSKIPSNGKPLANTVWMHLNHLMESSGHLTKEAIPSFLHDLNRTYDFLQDNLEESYNAFTHTKSPLWLNLAITDDKWVGPEDLRSSWVKIEHLVLLSSCDSPPLVSVQERLMRHQRLLKKLGCRTIVYPANTAVDAGAAESLSASMSRLRRDGKMIDIVLSADGKEVQAHKIVLAAVSASFEANFKGAWADDKKIELLDMSFDTLSAVVDFAYTDIFDWTPWRVTENDTVDETADKLDNLIDLLRAADRFLMPGLQSKVEGEILSATLFFIRIDNVRDIRDIAAEINAHRLEKACQAFYEKNRELVDLAYAERNR